MNYILAIEKERHTLEYVFAWDPDPKKLHLRKKKIYKSSDHHNQSYAKRTYNKKFTSMQLHPRPLEQLT